MNRDKHRLTGHFGAAEDVCLHIVQGMGNNTLIYPWEFILTTFLSVSIAPKRFSGSERVGKTAREVKHQLNRCFLSNAKQMWERNRETPAIGRLISSLLNLLSCFQHLLSCCQNDRRIM